MNTLAPTMARPWKAFGNPMLERIELHSKSGICLLTSNGNPVMAMNTDDVRDLIDSLQKFLAVTE